jgi:hypothetical protein
MSTARRVREWEQDKLPDGWGQEAPVNVGKQGRKKDRARMEQMAQDADDDADDWFGNSGNTRKSGPSRSVNGGRGGKGMGGKKISFGFSASHLQVSSSTLASDQNPPHSTPSLVDRIGSSSNVRPQHNPPKRLKASYSYRDRDAPDATAWFRTTVERQRRQNRRTWASLQRRLQEIRSTRE